MNTQELLTVRELADWLRTSEDWVQRHAKTLDLPSIRIGKLLRFRREEIEHYLQARSSDGLAA